MGCDGGTIPTRDELVRLKKKPEQKDKTADLAAKWKLCAITQEPLRKPVMACELGRLYNKESILELLIDRSKFECAYSFEHLRGLKDVKELQLTENKNYRQKSEKGDGYIDTKIAQFICPVVGIEMNGSYKFCFLWSCGCTMSERALKEIKAKSCHKCGKAFSKEDMIVMNGTDEEVEQLAAKMEEKRLKQKLEKKAKKAKQKQETATSASASSTPVEDDGPSSSKQQKLDTQDSKLTNGAAASKDPSAHWSSAKFTTGASSKLTNGNQPKLGGAIASGSQSKLGNGLAEASKPKGSIQKDPKASSAYKSLFTSSDRAKNQMKGHWVTSNPYWM